MFHSGQFADDGKFQYCLFIDPKEVLLAGFGWLSDTQCTDGALMPANQSLVALWLQDVYAALLDIWLTEPGQLSLTQQGESLRSWLAAECV